MFDKNQLRELMRGSVKTVNVPEWGGDVGIRMLSAADLVHLRSFAKDDATKATADDDLNAMCELLSMALSDLDGKRMFTPDELREWSGSQIGIMNQLVEETQKHNGFGKQADEELTKNSASGQTFDST